MAAPHHVFPRLRPWHTGVVLMVVGAAAVLAGLAQTTLSRAGVENCPPGTILVAKFAYSGDHYVFVGPDVNRNVVTIEAGSAAGGNWHSTIAISQVIVSGGPGAVMSALVPLQTGSHFSGAGLPKPPGGTPPGVEIVQFCLPSPDPTVVSTDAPTSSSSVPGSTTTVGGSTTTSFQPASTTVAQSLASTTATSVAPLQPSSISNGKPTTTTPGTTSSHNTTTTRKPTAPLGTATTLRPSRPPINATTTTIAGAPVTIARPTTTVKGETTTTTINPDTTGSTIPTTISPNIGTSTSVYFTAASLPAAQLPHHGSPSAMLIWIGIVLAGAGLGVTLVGFRRERGPA